jgi:hypothetical protein
MTLSFCPVYLFFVEAMTFFGAVRLVPVPIPLNFVGCSVIYMSNTIPALARVPLCTILHLHLFDRFVTSYVSPIVT